MSADVTNLPDDVSADDANFTLDADCGGNCAGARNAGYSEDPEDDYECTCAEDAEYDRECAAESAAGI